MGSIGRIERLAERRKLSEESERGPLNLQDLHRAALLSPDCRTAGHAGQDAHFAELSARRQLRDFEVRIVWRRDENISLAANHCEECIPAPFSLADNGLAGLEG